MATSFPTYPATTFEQAVELAIFSSNQLHNIINADPLSTVETEDGDIPSVRKALIENLYFKTPAIAWVKGTSVTVFNQLYTFSGGNTGTALWYAPTATTTNPIVMGSSPEDDSNWKIYGWDTYSKSEISSTSGASYIGTSTGNNVQEELNSRLQYVQNYEDGVVQITSKNQLIRYAGKLYYVSASTTLPFSTTGNTSTSWDTDKGNFEAVGDTTLRSDLISDSGGLLIGDCPDVATLRTIEPTAADQSITVVRYATGCPIANKTVTYDATDTTTVDDGYSVFVTSGGKRWKVDTSAGLDLKFTGLKSDGSNFGSIINAFAISEVKKIVSAGSFLAGITRINVPAKLGPVVGSYTIDQDIVLPSFMTLVFEDFCEIVDKGTTGYAIAFNNSPFYTNYGMKGSYVTEFVHSQGAKGISVLAGMPHLVGVSGDGKTSTRSGLFVGNTLGSTDTKEVLNVRDMTFDGIQIRQFFIGVDTTSKNTYLLTFNNFIIANNYYNVSNSVADAANGGERITFNNATIGNAVGHNIAPNAVGQGLEFHSCSIDYAAGSVIFFRYSGRRVNIKFTGNTWIEGFGRYLIEDGGTGAWASALFNVVTFSSGFLLGANGVYPANNGRRPIIMCESTQMLVNIDLMDIYFAGAPSSANASLVTLGSRTKVRIRSTNSPGLHGKVLPDYRSSLNFGGYMFSGTAGTSLKGATDPATGYSFNTISDGTGFTIAYGTVGSVTVDSTTTLQPVTVTAAAAANSWLLSNSKLFHKLSRTGDTIRANVTLNNSGITSGDLSVALRLDVYSESDLTTAIAAYYGTPVSLGAYYTLSGTTLTSTDYIGVELFATLPDTSVAGVHGSIVVRPSLRFTGAVGTYNVVLPAFYSEEL
ncbi:MAG: hypothetical protein [Cystoviridae sp.]|nr:MAG: hypothetical protein [Cystoviridae sp.]